MRRACVWLSERGLARGSGSVTEDVRTDQLGEQIEDLARMSVATQALLAKDRLAIDVDFEDAPGRGD